MGTKNEKLRKVINRLPRADGFVIGYIFNITMI